MNDEELATTLHDVWAESGTRVKDKSFDDWLRVARKAREVLIGNMTVTCLNDDDLAAENERLRRAIDEVLSWNGSGEGIGCDIQDRLRKARYSPE